MTISNQFRVLGFYWKHCVKVSIIFACLISRGVIDFVHVGGLNYFLISYWSEVNLLVIFFSIRIHLSL